MMLQSSTQWARGATQLWKSPSDRSRSISVVSPNHNRGIMKSRLALCALIIAAGVARADRIDDLERKIDALVAEQEDLQSQIMTLKSQLGANAFTDTVSVPATQPTAVAKSKVNRAGPWNVMITANIAPDVANVQSQLSDEQSKLPSLESTYLDLQRHYDWMLGQRISTGTTYAGNGLYNNNYRQRYSPSELDSASAAAARAKDDLQRQKQKVAKLQRDYDTATTSWTVVATLDDGSSVEILGQGNVARSLVQPMRVGQHYKVEGTSLLNNGRLTLNVRAVTPLD